MITRRQIVTASAGLAVAGTAPGQTAERPYDILIRNGEVRDPASGYKARADVAIRDGKIAAIESSLPAEKAREVIDARGLYVVPGLVDLHTHIYYGGGSVPGIEADSVAARSGVTTWVDAGSFAYDNVAGFLRIFLINRWQGNDRIRAHLLRVDGVPHGRIGVGPLSAGRSFPAAAPSASAPFHPLRFTQRGALAGKLRPHKAMNSAPVDKTELLHQSSPP
ncbi:MAG: hypothetical protein EXQ57_02195 [Bryobacterales bacterium]|nr:hypothetical protein [Bryobacterales bacterium]